MVVVMGYVLVQFTEKGLSEIAGEGYYVERDRLRIEAYSALEVTLAVLADFIAVDRSLQSPAQGWADPIGYAGIDFGNRLTVRIAFSDESARLPLNSLDEGSLFLLFDEIGIPPEDSLLLTNSLLDWIDEDDETRIDGAESDEYGFREIPHRAANRPIRNLMELSVVKGFDIYFFDEDGRPNAIFDTFAEVVSPYGLGTLNANTAGMTTLRVAGSMGDPQLDAIDDYLAGADGIPGNEDDRFFESKEELLDVIVEMPPDITLGVNISILSVEIQVSEGNSVFALKAVISLDESGRSTDQASQTQPDQASFGSLDRLVEYPFVFLELTEDVSNNGMTPPAPQEQEEGEIRI
jgi:hypothetical protein